MAAELNEIDQPTLKLPVDLSQITSKARFTMADKAVLLVDDDRKTALFVRHALKHLDFPPALQYVPNGLEAVQYLTGQGRFANRDVYPMPHLVLVDLKMPLMDGFELLEWLRSQPCFHLLPAVIISGSMYAPDAERALSMGANAFQVKSGELRDFERSLEEIFARFLDPAEAVDA